MNDTMAIHGGEPVFRKDELKSLLPHWPVPHPETEQRLIDVFRSGKWGGCGPYEQKLMTEFAEFQDTQYAVWMCNGTTTLECALLALDIGPGDEVIVPGVTWVATAQAPLYCGAIPVIVDIDPDTLCIDPARIEEAITPRTKAIIPVHLYSAIADMDKINFIAKKYNLHVIEDCAHAHGAKQHGRGTGSHGDIGSFSFQFSKLMTGGEGGCCTTNNEKYADRLFRLSHIGNSRMNPKVPLETGLMCHQYRFTEFQAAIIYDQLLHQAEYRAKRQANAELMRQLIKDVPSVKMQESSCPDDFRDYYFVTFLLQRDQIKPGVERAEIYSALTAEGFQLHEGWGCPLYKNPAWNIPENMYIRHDTSNCEEVMYKRIMCTMHTVFLTEPETIERCAGVLRKVMKFYSK